MKNEPSLYLIAALLQTELLRMTDPPSDCVSIADLIASKVDDFEPMIVRSNSATTIDREAWAIETVRERHERVSREVYALCNGTVKYGPFIGMKLSAGRWWGQRDLGSQCLGLYEKEILDFVETGHAGCGDTFIDIGATDGYYAIGMLLSGRAQQAICFESSERGRATIFENWELNGRPGALTVYGEASSTSIVESLATDLLGSLVLIDVEGAEFAILSEAVLALFSKSTVIIEIHNWVDDFIKQYSALLVRAHERFHVSIMDRTECATTHLSELRDFTDDNRALLVSESRPCIMRFIMLSPRSGA